MSLKKEILIFVSLLLLALSLSAKSRNEDYYFSKIEGLSQTSVKAIIQDSWGFMWFGTKNKLYRYDGTTATIFDCYDKIKKKRSNNISALFEDRDKNLWIGTDAGIYIFDPILETFSFLDIPTANGTKIKDWIADIQKGSDNNIWIVVPNQGLFKYHTSDRKMYFYDLGGKSSPSYGYPQSILIEKNGKVWVGTNGRGVFRYNKQSDSFTQLLGDHNGSTLESEHIFTMCDYGDEIIIGIHNGKLKKLHKLKNTLLDFNIPEIQNKVIRHIVRNDDDIWVGTESGLYIINEVNQTLAYLHTNTMLPYSLSDNRIYNIYRDKEDGMWIATYAGGVNYLPQRAIKFEQYIALNNQNSISSNQIRNLKEIPDGNIWIGTEDAGVSIFNPKTKQFSQILNAGKSQAAILSISVQGDDVWIGRFKEGLDVVNYPSLTSKHYTGEQLGLNESTISTIQEDKEGNIWIGNGWGMYFASKGSLKFENRKEFGLNFIFDILEDSEGYIWAASMGNGVYMYNPQTKKTRHFLYKENDASSLSSNSVSSITEDSKGYIWLSTDRGGICRYDKSSDTFKTYSVREGLPNDVTYKILEDKRGYLWFGTDNGLVRFNPTSKDVRIFTTNDGLFGNRFNYKSALIASSGRFYFGGFNGLLSFNPYDFKENLFIPSVYITNMTISNRKVEVGVQESPLEQSIIHTKKMKLNHDQSNLSFDFVALSYNAPSANKYCYMMEGIDAEWIYTTNNQSASYTKIPPGKYVFKVKGSNNDGLWNDQATEIEIEILPPWWSSNLAFIVYGLLFCISLYSIGLWYRRKSKKEQLEKLRIQNAEKEKEIYDAKLEFFTEIAHEIRTPLTLINGPLETLLAVDYKDTFLQKNLKTIDRNTNHLLNLVNQLLDFKKINSVSKVLNFSELDIAKTIRNVVLQFEPMAKAQAKEIDLILPEEDIIAQIDPNEFSKILNNLLINAVKYSDRYVRIELHRNDEYFTIVIKNDGEIIPEAYHENIFEPFYQLKTNDEIVSGSGIGLPLARSLTALHGGNLYLKSDENFNVFIVELPLNQEAYDGVNGESNIQGNEESYNLNKDRTMVVLVVEDHVEMLSFISDFLSDYFIIEKASSGKDALAILKNQHVDLIISDVMMPDMNGLELCKLLKDDVEFSHIPIVLLTAKNDLPSKIKGLEAGAEAYVEKPFSSAFLLTQVSSILENRKRERAAFVNKPFLPLQQLNISKSDEKFMNSVIEVINENITKAEFNIDMLAESSCMSRSNLHRKIKIITGLAPNEFVRLIRLKKAAEIISSGEYRVGEVCYLVGINSSSYFIKLFQKQFGMTPKEFEQQSAYTEPITSEPN